MDFDVGSFDSQLVRQSQLKKRRISLNNVGSSSSCQVLSKINACLPTLRSSDYFMEPCLSELVTRELIDPGYCCRVKDFTVGRLGYGRVKFIGETDVRWLDLDQIIKFSRHEVVVYEEEDAKPVVGQGLNKAAEVTLTLQIRTSTDFGEGQLREVARKLRHCTERQGACFISFDPSNGEWKFLVHHFSRFGLTEDDEEDITMDDATRSTRSLGDEWWRGF
ncbi:Nuclear pore complex protein NUP96 [Camellia lanceoleosa]|uniref:Nuclear pore complex protein NUP96 n=1 Tax=Camellia lanceoleosa TaxID=1840588 RepID=A0ACC0I4F7_9ERIC|nr:Nuclear pore complex protein NUP96 [Camellia lanceoleosa]